MKINRPMLAGKAPEDLSVLRYPVLTSPKIDGIRCVIVGGKVLARSLKPIPNQHVRTTIEDLVSRHRMLEGFDGELVSGRTFSETTSALMSRGGRPAFGYYVFDRCGPEPFNERLTQVANITRTVGAAWLNVVPHKVAFSAADVEAQEALALAAGFEGLMIRDPDGPYKFGRSTTNEGWLLKLKRFVDSEAEVVGYKEQQHNTNEAATNELGRTKRSHAQAGLVGAGMLGKLIVRDLMTGVEFGLGTGFDAASRERLWREREQLVGKVVKYKSQPYGVEDAPRLPVFIGFRAPEDTDG